MVYKNKFNCQNTGETNQYIKQVFDQVIFKKKPFLSFT